MKRILLTFMVLVAGLSVIAHDINAQGKSRASTRQERMEQWHKDMAAFRARTEQTHELHQLADSIAGVQATAAIRNKDFVLEVEQVTFNSGMTTFVNSNTNFVSVKGNRAVVQISPSNFASGPNGVGGVTVQGMITSPEMKVDSRGRITYSFNVMGIGINAQVEIYMFPGTNSATATIYPNFNSNTIWLDGNIVPYENSNVIEGSTL